MIIKSTLPTPRRASSRALFSLLLSSSLALACEGKSGEAAPTDAAPTETPAASGDAQPQTPTETPPVTADRRPDPHSFSRPDQVRVTHMGLDWDVDFARKRLRGEAAMQIQRIDPKAPLILDVRGIDVLAVEVAAGQLDPNPAAEAEKVLALALRKEPLDWKATPFELGESEGTLGQPLEIELPEEVTLVRVRYQTTADASGLQWLAPEQTAGKEEPFLYSQSQAIHARSWIPCQDSPGVRVTFDARISAPAPFTAVMAANMLDGETPTQHEGKRSFRFVMPQPVPSYLIAIGVGKLARQELGARSAVWADPATIEAAAYEFADVENMITTAEGLYGPYRWGRYDLLVLPPAFPFGGMENPRLTFATPTILAGDRSLVSLVAHELAHSWSGNLVTNSTWEDLWLNEGFTVYFERRIVEALYGKDRAEMEATLGRQDLEDEYAGDLKDRPADRKLHAQLEGRDPDDYFSNVPYEKGALFLGALEAAYGRETFDAFLRGWFDQNAFGSVDSAKFRTYLQAELIGKAKPLEGKTAPDPEAWIEGTDIPADAPKPSSPAFAEVDAQFEAWSTGKKPAKKLETKSWTPHEWLHFLRALPDTTSTEQMAELDAAFGLTKSGNSEIVAEWLALAARVRYEPAFDRLDEFLTTVGRRKFLTPLYKALLATDAGRAQAKAIYTKARPGYHAISQRTLDELLGWEAK